MVRDSGDDDDNVDGDDDNNDAAEDVDDSYSSDESASRGDSVSPSHRKNIDTYTHIPSVGTC